MFFQVRTKPALYLLENLMDEDIKWNFEPENESSESQMVLPPPLDRINSETIDEILPVDVTSNKKRPKKKDQIAYKRTKESVPDELRETAASEVLNDTYVKGQTNESNQTKVDNKDKTIESNKQSIMNTSDDTTSSDPAPKYEIISKNDKHKHKSKSKKDHEKIPNSSIGSEKSAAVNQMPNISQDQIKKIKHEEESATASNINDSVTDSEAINDSKQDDDSTVSQQS